MKRDDPDAKSIEQVIPDYRIEADHDPIEPLCRATLGFKAMTALATIKGFEVMRMIRKRQCILLEPGVTDEVRFVAKLWSLRATVARHRGNREIHRQSIATAPNRRILL